MNVTHGLPLAVPRVVEDRVVVKRFLVTPTAPVDQPRLVLREGARVRPVGPHPVEVVSDIAHGVAIKVKLSTILRLAGPEEKLFETMTPDAMEGRHDPPVSTT